MNVTACLVTRGDVDIQPVIDSLPLEWEIVIWDNAIGHPMLNVRRDDGFSEIPLRPWIVGQARSERPDLSVYGRYAAIEYATNDLIYVQDDDVIVSDPQTIVEAWRGSRSVGVEDEGRGNDHVVCNMPQEFRPHYPDSGLVGFGACFHRDAPGRAFDRFGKHEGWASHSLAGLNDVGEKQRGMFLRRCDNVFTVLTPRVLVDVTKTDREMASDPDRMWKQPGHTAERDQMIDLARRVRDE